jgi:hypothetical protein
VRPVGEVAEHLGQRREATLVGGRAGRDVAVGVHADPVDVVAGVVGELGEERPLGAAVALPERVQGVNVGEEFRGPADELLPVQAAQPVCRR